MSCYVCSLFVLYVFVSRVTLVYAAPFTHFFARDAGNSSPTGFKLQNGIKAQQLNAQFATLTASDSCTAGSIACVNAAFAQCVGGKWTLTQCSNDLACFALPLVNSPGTSIACDTEQDALARISASGASGGLTGAGNGTNSAASASGPTASNTTVTAPSNAPTNTINSAASTPTSNTNDSGGGSGNSANSTTGGDDSGNDDDCHDDPTESSSSNGNSTAADSSDKGSGDDDDCHDDSAESSSPNGNSTAVDSSDKGGDCDGDGSSGPGGNSTNSINTSTDTSGAINVMSNSAPATTNASQVSSDESNQLYRRQFIPDTGVATFAVPTQTPSFSSFTPTASFPNAPANTATDVPGAGTVTFILVSTVTMTVSGCQGNPSSLPPIVAGTPGFSPTNSAAFTLTPASSTPTASIPQSNAFATPTSLGDSGISFSTQGGGNNVDLEPTPTPAFPANGPSSTLNLSELLTATA